MTVADTRAVVLDTHVLVWLLQGSERVGPRSRELIAAAVQADSVYVAAISTWEVAMLVANGRLALDREVGEWLSAALRLPGLRLAALDLLVAVDSTRLPGDVHGDSADRLIGRAGRRRPGRTHRKAQRLRPAAEPHVTDTVGTDEASRGPGQGGTYMRVARTHQITILQCTLCPGERTPQNRLSQGNRSRASR